MIYPNIILDAYLLYFKCQSIYIKGCGWSKNNNPRFKNLNMDIITGPGAYNINKELIPRYKYNVTSSFASTSLKCDLLV